MSRILAIEPDPARGRALKRLVRERIDAEVVLAPSMEVAIAAIAEQVPDVILTSALMSPSDDLHLKTHFKRVPDLWRLPILTIPPVVDPHDGPLSTSRGMLSIFKRRPAPPWPAYDHEALTTRIEEALRHSRSAQISRQVSLLPVPDALTATRAFEHVGPDASGVTDEELLEHLGLGIKRLRAHRWIGSDLPWLSAVKLPWGLEVELVNISSSGLLIESVNKLMPGISTTFQLWGPNKELLVPARVVRSRVADVNSRGVTYHAAAVFERNLELPVLRATGPRTSDGTPMVLEGLLDRVRRKAERGADPAAIRTAFELGIQELVTAREIRIRDVPVVDSDGSDSVYFTVPTRDESSVILQATFETDYQPHAEEFDLLKEAAIIAADVLEIESSSQTKLLLIA